MSAIDETASSPALNGPGVSGIEAVGVVVPVKDEQVLLPACLAALDAAAAGLPVPVTVVVVLDACSDQSPAVVELARQQTPHISLSATAIAENSVGAARRTGMQILLEQHPAETLWLATTDADSIVPTHWLRAQLAHATDGAHVVVGTVTVTDWQEHSPAVRDRAISDYAATHHGHVHGANLAFTAAAYRAAGGFPAQPSGEDVSLVQEFIAAGEPIAWALDLAVATSARRKSRAPSGFAQYLVALGSQVSSSPA
ncbi:Glycosyl transferase family 2 [Frankineae bacterium MT45]|nr:Glycosyl transferase family 2 [Frankineae bacterium MT45]